jgi:hypothetical protein
MNMIRNKTKRIGRSKKYEQEIKYGTCYSPSKPGKVQGSKWRRSHSSEIRERGVAAKKKTKSTRRNTYGYIIIDICKFLI